MGGFEDSVAPNGEEALALTFDEDDGPELDDAWRQAERKRIQERERRERRRREKERDKQ